MAASSATQLGAGAPRLSDLTEHRRARRARRRSPILRPGWPLSGLLIGYPLWWALGITEIVSLAAAAVMAVELARRRRLAVPVGFGLWALFLAWVVIGALVVQVDPVGAVAGDSPTRYLTGGFRLAWYLRATVVLLYVVNLPQGRGTQWVTRTFSWMFVTITVGGLMGTLFPAFSFSSLIELVLPAGVRSIPFVRSIIHPVMSELQNNLGDHNLRPSAPFAYANEWGFNFACFLPFFLISWLGREAGWRKFAAPFVLAAALVPVIFSLNRGLWFALVTAGVFVALRSAQAGRVRLLGTLIAGFLLLGAVLLASPLGRTVQNRLENGKSDSGRITLAVQGLTTMAKTSPLVGFGTTRRVQGGFESIAQGATTDCPRCTPPSLGTQGQLSLVAFCQGVGGFLLYFGFMTLQFLRHIRIRSPVATVGLSLIVIHLVTSPVYGADNLGLVAVMAGIGLLYHESGPRSSRGPTLTAYGAVLRHGVRAIVVCMTLGAMAGLLVQSQQGTRSIAKVSILVPDEPSYFGEDVVTQTLDTEAQLATNAALKGPAALAEASSPGADSLRITATPNSRILNLTYSTTAGGRVARQGVQAAARAALGARRTSLEDRQTQVLRTLNARSIALSASISRVNRTLASLRLLARLQQQPNQSTTLFEARARLLLEAGDVGSQINRATSLPLEVGQTLGPADVNQTRDDWLVALAGGLALGLAGGVALAVLRETLSPRLARRRVRDGCVGMPTAGLLSAPVTYISADGSEGAVTLARALDEQARAEARGGDVPDTHGRPPVERCRVVLVASRRSRARVVTCATSELTSTGVDVVGYVVAGARPARSS